MFKVFLIFIRCYFSFQGQQGGTGQEVLLSSKPWKPRPKLPQEEEEEKQRNLCRFLEGRKLAEYRMTGKNSFRPQKAQHKEAVILKIAFVLQSDALGDEAS